MTAEITVTGAVQGIGYRPFVAELATEYGLHGNVRNSGGIVRILAEGSESVICAFTQKLRTAYPAGAMVISVTCRKCSEDLIKSDAFASDFIIIESEQGILSEELPVFPPDLGICDDCMREMQDPADRRYEYPLISCASCGPRYSILKSLPYDREATTMQHFEMCPTCSMEYGKGRRRHAQTISCHDCGPQIIFEGRVGENTAKVIRLEKADAMAAAIRIIKDGGIIGIKGIGGYQLAATPFAGETVDRLRKLKGREKKPFAVMFPDLETVRTYASVSTAEQRLLQSSARPIVLLPAKQEENVPVFSAETCGESRFIGAFLPATGLHRMILKETGPLIVTSANNSGEPMLVADDVFRNRYLTETDGMLYHERQILTPLDDSVMFCVSSEDGGFMSCLIRRARGYVPLPVFLQTDLKSTVFAAGGDLKGAFALGRGSRIILSQFLGDMADYGVQQNYRSELQRMERIFGAEPQRVVCDMHPGYYSSALATEYAKEHHLPAPMRIQHHHAHIASVMAEHGLTSCIGVAFDGTGYGTDGQLWGGEFLHCSHSRMQRMGHLQYVTLCGGDRVSADARLAAACYEYASEGTTLYSEPDESRRRLTEAALQNHINTIQSSSMGRLFDAAACALEIRNANSYEGECAIALENAAASYLQQNPGALTRLIEEISAVSQTGQTHADALEHEPFLRIFREEADGTLQADQITFLQELRRKMQSCKGIEASEYRNLQGKMALEFHTAIICTTVRMCEEIRTRTGENTVALSGGVFANRILLQGCTGYLRKKKFMVYCNESVPFNDGGISLGQAFLAGMDD
ncbi:MAG: carbamoyltransferase HypF [Butyrivibrio sp.]|jgi:hydrogenase maturation protein HypF|nr:carbamoyltransferase HypF [Butyrivibrio sp.]